MSGEATSRNLRRLVKEKRRVEQLLACRGRRLIWFDTRWDQERAREAGVEWTEDLNDPEFNKNLRILHELIDGAIGICERAQDKPSEAERSERERLITSRVVDLARRLGLPRGGPLTLKVLLERRFEAEQLLIELGDEHYLRTRAAALYHERKGTFARWREIFGDRLPPLLVEPVEEVSVETKNRDAQDANLAVEATRLMLQRVIAAKAEQDRPLRARRELKGRVLRVILPVILAATSLFALALGLVEDEVERVLLAAAAGLSGAALGGLIKLRDEVDRGAQLRAFTEFYLGQLLIGASAGLIAFVVDRSGIVDLTGGPVGVAAFAFALGYSEAAFVGLLARIGEPPRDADTRPRR